MKRMKLFPSVLTLLFLSNCGRIIDWTTSNFYQGQDVTLCTKNVEPFIQSVTIYDQLQTVAHFSAMWLSDTVRTAYSQLHVKRLGLGEDRFKPFLRRQLEENSHFVSFYILSTHDVKLGVPESHWSLFLRIDDVDYLPLELKEVELPTEYQEFFGKEWNRFKVPYLVKFSYKDENDEPIITDAVKEMCLFVRSAEKEHVFSWDIQYEDPNEYLFNEPCE